MLRDTFECYTLFKKHPEAFETSTNFGEFIAAASLEYLRDYAGGWVELAFSTMKAGKETYRPLYFPKAEKFNDLFTAGFFIPTDAKMKPAGSHYIGGDAGLARHCEGIRGWSKNMPDVRSHYGTKFYGSYVIPTDDVKAACLGYFGKGETVSFEAINRDDGVLITARWSYPGEIWLALLEKGANIETLFDETTRAFIAAEHQADIDAWENP